MKVLLVAESCFGNTSRVADAVAAGLRSCGATVTVVDAASAPTRTTLISSLSAPHPQHGASLAGLSSSG